MAIELTSSMFAGNFIRELPRKRCKAKGRPNGTLRRYVLLRCNHCGVEFEADLWGAKRTKQQCCSQHCYRRHIEVFPGGNERHPLYSRWLSMLQRINNPLNPGYHDYGGRGIQIEDGLDDFITYALFIESLPEYSLDTINDLQVDRKDTNGNYAKNNLRLATRNTQSANQRPNSKGFNRFTGVSWAPIHNCWVARVVYEGKNYCSSTHPTEEAALLARNTCIKENNLPHPIQPFH